MLDRVAAGYYFAALPLLLAYSFTAIVLVDQVEVSWVKFQWHFMKIALAVLTLFALYYHLLAAGLVEVLTCGAAHSSWLTASVRPYDLLGGVAAVSMLVHVHVGHMPLFVA